MSPDPDIQAAWNQARTHLAALLRPYIQAHLIDNLVKEFVIGHLNAEGWRPPLRPLPDVVRENRLRPGGQS